MPSPFRVPRTVLCLCLLAAHPPAAVSGERVERRVGAMGTTLALAVEHQDRAEAVAASEIAVRAIEAVERRLSTWRDDSELSALNRATVEQPFTLGMETARDLATALAWSRATGGAFDPALGSLVELWDLRGRGRIPSDNALQAAIVPGGAAASLSLEGRTAVRRHASARIEEGAFGKGCGLDAALEALARTSPGARAVLDLGGQVAVFNAREPLAIDIADPRDRTRPVVRWMLTTGSISTSGNSEAAREVDGVRVGHVLDPRSGRPARDFGSASAWAASAAAADCVSTALFVLGPDEALAWAEPRDDVEALLIEVAGERLRVRATSGLRDRVRALAADVELSFSETPAREAR